MSDYSDQIDDPYERAIEKLRWLAAASRSGQYEPGWPQPIRFAVCDDDCENATAVFNLEPGDFLVLVFYKLHSPGKLTHAWTIGTDRGPRAPTQGELDKALKIHLLGEHPEML